MNLLLADATAHAGSAVGAGAEEIVLHLLYQLLAILVVTRVVTWVSRRFFAQTDVSGEILAGIVLGPSLLSALFPGFMAELFHPSTRTIFVGLAQVGLVLLMFQIGLEFEFKSHLGKDRKPIFVISVVGLFLPFLCGYLAAPYFWHQFAEPRPSLFGFRLFFAVAMSITAIPILGRIFMELGLSHTRTAALTIGAAAIDDVAGWLVLGVISVLVKAETSHVAGVAPWRWVLPRLVGLAIYAAVVFLLVRPNLKRAIAQNLQKNDGLRVPAIAWMLIVLFASAAITSNLGIFAIIGGFVIGVALHDDRRFVNEWKLRVSPLVWTFFLPIFFAYTGLRTEIGSLHGWNGVVTCALVCGIAFATKFGGAYVAARLMGETNRSAATIGVCMNTRALMELIALNIGYDLGVLPKPMFTMLVIMAIVRTFIATPIIRVLMNRERREVGHIPMPSALPEPVGAK
ncbi:MAG: cation:proton antiporter [Planctomycetes bacterium]|nr:cation:proton antiporter [Planctomycetota bacterium]